MRRFPLTEVPGAPGGWRQAISLPTPSGPYLAAIGRVPGQCDAVAIGVHNLPDGAPVSWSISIALGAGRLKVANSGGIGTRDTVLVLASSAGAGAGFDVDATVWAVVGGKTIGSVRIKRTFGCGGGGPGS